MTGFQLQRLSQVMGPEPGNPLEAEGVTNPAAARGPDGQLYLFPRLVATGNYSRIGIARVLFNGSGDPPQRFDVYYGMADDRIGAARFAVPDLLPPREVSLQRPVPARTSALSSGLGGSGSVPGALSTWPGHQFHFPSRATVEGTSSVRTRNVSIRTPIAKPKPTSRI
jgi:hypothetical protein